MLHCPEIFAEPCRKPVVKEAKPEKQALLGKGSGKGSEGRVDIQVTAGQVRPDAEPNNSALLPTMIDVPGEGLGILPHIDIG